MRKEDNYDKHLHNKSNNLQQNAYNQGSGYPYA